MTARKTVKRRRVRRRTIGIRSGRSFCRKRKWSGGGHLRGGWRTDRCLVRSSERRLCSTKGSGTWRRTLDRETTSSTSTTPGRTRSGRFARPRRRISTGSS
uniref:(northern house mosquito) hypothetical protein n=1 Tax=Culex pipiens TaxID=7175 RepID=A0A8D8LF20_CULPI